jgi:Tol biopolymer transport system component
MRAYMVLGFAVAAGCVFWMAPSAEGTSAGSSADALAVIENGNVYAIAVVGNRIVRLSRTHVPDDASVSPDGTTLAYSVQRKDSVSELWAMRIDGSRRSRLTQHNDDLRPVWSPNGRSIFFERLLPSGFAAPCRSIFRVGRDGHGVRRVTHSRNFHDHIAPSVSPDEQRVAYTDVNLCESGNDSDALRVAYMTGQRTTDLRRLPGNKYYPTRQYWSPTWSPDSKRLAFLSSDGLDVANRDGSHLRLLSRIGSGTPYGGARPAWSPDGKWIAFAGGSLYLVHPDGSGLHRLPRTANAFWVSWLPHMPG